MKRMFVMCLICIVLSLVSLPGFGQLQTSAAVDSCAHQIARHNIYEMSYTVGITGTVSPQYKRFQQLLTLATTEQLWKLATKDKNAVVRLYGYQALKRRNKAEAASAERILLKDSTMVQALKGEHSFEARVNELLNAEIFKVAQYR